jgi:lipoprotein-releasing system permease protein
MYQFLLCWRYLRTRYIALASVVSVMLGVATMIVVNSVMAGFTTEMQDRIHGILSDLEFRSHSMEGFPDPEGVMARIRELVGDDIASMTVTVQVPAMLSFQYGGQWVTRQVHIVGIDERTQSNTSDFGKYLLHPGNREQFSFALRDGGFDTMDRQLGPDAPDRLLMGEAGWTWRRRRAESDRRYREWHQQGAETEGEPTNDAASAAEDELDHNADPASVAEQRATLDPAAAPKEPAAKQANPFAARKEEPAAVFDPAKDQHTGVVLGIALANFQTADKAEGFLVLPGDDVKLTFPTAGTPPRAIDDEFTIVDFYESKMSEYDSNLVFVPIRKLQELRGMIDPTSGVPFATAIQIKLKDQSRGDVVRDKLRAAFPPEIYGVYTWRDKQGPLLAAVQMETAILNVLLFMIIAVAGFGILAIFFMIVVEKTRDIGILKSLGASGRGIMGIFLGYGLSLGIVGSGVGMVLGLLFVAYINEIADVLAFITGQEVFDPTIYYFYKIPTIVEPFTVAWVVVGAMLIAVLASILPARRAARLHPVEALRFE